MANPIVLDWLDENKLRAYPIAENSVKTSSLSYTLSDSIFLDANIVVSDSELTVCKILSIVVSSSIVINISDSQSFTVALDASFPAYVRNAQGSLLVISADILNIPSGTHNFTDLKFEDSAWIEYTGEWAGVSSISNTEDSIQDIVELEDGYQSEILIEDPANIKLLIGNLYGKAIGCNWPVVVDADCSDIVSHINGVLPDGNNILYIVAGNNFVVWDDPDNHRIYIGYAFTSIDDICKPPLPFPIN